MVDELPGEVSTCRLIKKEDGRTSIGQPGHDDRTHDRAYAPWPSAFTTWQGENFKILRRAGRARRATPGHVVAADGGVAVGTGDGLLQLDEVQPCGQAPWKSPASSTGRPILWGRIWKREARGLPGRGQ
ncbi:MAG: hypothetical protein R2838_23160 [Caldilineaceae bacterium]